MDRQYIRIPCRNQIGPDPERLPLLTLQYEDKHRTCWVFDRPDTPDVEPDAFRGFRVEVDKETAEAVLRGVPTCYAKALYLAGATYGWIGGQPAWRIPWGDLALHTANIEASPPDPMPPRVVTGADIRRWREHGVDRLGE